LSQIVTDHDRRIQSSSSFEYQQFGFKRGYEEEKSEGLLQKLLSLKSNSIYLKLVLALSGLYFVVSGI